ncbi:MAG: Gx transporter family protein [Clostridia bacterium]|nr:Gx transporter family protein [Clostridia bacterium]
MKTKTFTQNLALVGILSAQAIALSYLESLIPAIPGFPPGAKPGLSNIVTMFSAGALGIWQTIYITFAKAIFAGVTRGLTAFLTSLAGGLLSTVVALILLQNKNNKLGYVGIGIICAVCHNIGQLCVACFISGTPELFTSYGPFLLLAAGVTGFLTGTILKYVMPALEKQMKFIIKSK